MAAALIAPWSIIRLFPETPPVTMEGVWMIATSTRLCCRTIRHQSRAAAALKVGFSDARSPETQHIAEASFAGGSQLPFPQSTPRRTASFTATAARAAQTTLPWPFPTHAPPPSRPSATETYPPIRNSPRTFIFQLNLPVLGKASPVHP